MISAPQVLKDSDSIVLEELQLHGEYFSMYLFIFY